MKIYSSNQLAATATILATYGIKMAHKSASTLRDQLMKPKTPWTLVVYTFNCKTCPTNFIGETGKGLRTRRKFKKLWMRMVEADDRFNFSEANITTQGGNKWIRLMNAA